MEQENIRRAMENGFQGIFTANANRLTQLISKTLNYKVRINALIVLISQDIWLFWVYFSYFESYKQSRQQLMIYYYNYL